MNRYSPIIYAGHAREFAAAARREAAVKPFSASMPAYFLAARAIELGLKSYMLAHGSTDADLRRISHDIAKALDAAKQAGLGDLMPISLDTDRDVRWINEYYHRKDLEYPTLGLKSYPQIEPLIGFAEALITAIEPDLRRWGLAQVPGGT